MPDFFSRLETLAASLRTFDGAARLAAGLCAAVVLLSVAVNFLLAKEASAARSEKRSVVATGSMLAFFVVYFGVVRLGLGAWPLARTWIGFAVRGLGLAWVIAGTIVNVLGRFSLGGNWGDQIRIYHDHSLVATGVYGVVRHPLYASLIWMFFGGALLFQNGLALAANLFLFVPAMYYRARQEELALCARFPEYDGYRREVGMFFPKLWSPK